MKLLRSLLTGIGLMIFSAVLFSQADSTIYKVKIDQYQRWQRAGSITMISGAAIELAGIGLVAYGFKASSEGESDDPYVIPGYALMGVGLATAVTGLIFRGIGKRKVTEYKIKLNDVRAGFYYTPNHSGIVLTYRF
jgi:hypothetical protein